MHITNWWRGIFENKKRFLFKRYPYTKTSLSFVAYIKVWNIQFNICSLFFRDFKYLMFSCFSVHLAGHILIDWRWICKNQERFLSITDPFTKNSLIFATAIKVWKIQFNFYSLFLRVLKYLIFYCFSVHIVGNILIDWRWIFKNKESFLSIMDPFTKTSLSVYAGVKYWEMWKLLWHLFSQKFAMFARNPICYF